MLPGQPFPQKIPAGKLSGYDTVMLLYLVSGAAILPLIIGELLVAAGLLEEMSESSMPPWMYGYVVFVMFAAAFALFVAWIPAIYICIKYRKQWRAVVPAAAILVLTAGLFTSMSSDEMSTFMEYTMGIVALFYAIAAFGIGLEWLLKRAK
ncbi:MAG TPA: hypothetical protein VIS04_04435 [Woeseiaceae bacterium]